MKVKRQFISGLLVASVIMGTLPMVWAEEAGNDIKVIVNGEAVDFADQAPVIQNGRTLVPFRAVFEKMGAEVRWFEDLRLCEATYADTTVGIVIGDNKVTLGEFEEIEGDVPAQIINGRTMVPLRILSEGIGAEVSWDSATKTVKVDTPEIIGEAPATANYDIKSASVADKVTVNYEYPVITDVYTAAPLLNEHINKDIESACADIASTAVTDEQELNVTCDIRYNTAGIFSVMYFINGEAVYWNNYTILNGGRMSDEGYAFVTGGYDEVEAEADSENIEESGQIAE